MSTITAVNEGTITLMSKTSKKDLNIPPQAQKIIIRINELCEKKEGNSCKIDTLIKSFMGEALSVKQTDKRIVMYYLPLLKEAGFISYTSMRGSSISLVLD